MIKKFTLPYLFPVARPQEIRERNIITKNLKPSLIIILLSKPRIVIFLFFLVSTRTVFTNMLMDMGIMMGGQTGAQIANQSISSMYQNMGASLTKGETNLQNSNSAFQNNVEKAQNKKMKDVLNFFQTAASHVSDLTNNQSTSMQQMETYILQAVSLAQPQSHYLSDPTTMDQFFTLATMYTPSGHDWKNVFPVGNWQYDETTDSFWQMNKEPMLTPETNPKTNITSTNANKAPNNSIFTEWITRQPSYEILCEVTLYQVSYPFFTGIIFNKARWVSGDTSRLQQYRLAGIYGDADNASINAGSPGQARGRRGIVQACFAEQTTPPATSKTKAAKTTATAATPTPPLYPLQQIISGSGVQPIVISQTVFESLQQHPVTFKIKIITSPETIKLKIWQSNTKEPQVFTTINSINKDLFLYHSIGFMSPGAIAEFKVINPTSLLFPTSARTIFTAQVEALLKKGV